jgi:hypothetical protein
MNPEFKDLREKLHKAVEEIDLEDTKILESVAAGAININVCESGCFKQK